jgi:Protein of unknown function (DUF2442)/Uncharacterized protein conserved in bacteria (DUF2188)
VTDQMHTIESVVPTGPARVRLVWSGGSEAELDLSKWLERPGFADLRNAAEFARVEVGDWGHSLTWPNGAEAGADRLWLETLSASGHDDARTFLEWRLNHGLSLSKAAEALGLSRRMIAYYSNGEKAVPRVVLLACLGWVSGSKSPRSPQNARLREQEILGVAAARPATISSGSYAANWKGRQGETKKHELFIVKRAQGDYAVRRGNAERASAVEATQAEAIERAREIDPQAAIHVERVRNTTGGHSDKWRKP